MKARDTSGMVTVAAAHGEQLVRVRELTMTNGPRLIQRDLNFDIMAGEVLAVVGASGCGKSTLLRHLTGLQRSDQGQVLYGDQDLNHADARTAAALRRQFGVMFQSGALWSSMSVADNLMLPLQLFTAFDRNSCEQQARFKLALVGLDGAGDHMPAELSGGMRKRAAIARALMLDPPLLYLDEPSAGLDPINSARLDDLILKLRQYLGTTVVMVTHELDSVFAVADRLLFLDEQEKTMIEPDTPQALLDRGPANVRAFLQRRHPT